MLFFSKIYSTLHNIWCYITYPSKYYAKKYSKQYSREYVDELANHIATNYDRYCKEAKQKLEQEYNYNDY